MIASYYYMFKRGKKCDYSENATANHQSGVFMPVCLEHWFRAKSTGFRHEMPQELKMDAI